jgi:hypothetical protein
MAILFGVPVIKSASTDAIGNLVKSAPSPALTKHLALLWTLQIGSMSKTLTSRASICYLALGLAQLQATNNIELKDKNKTISTSRVNHRARIYFSGAEHDV